MVGVSTPTLAAAVSESGALGSIGLGASDTAGAQAMLRATRELTQKPFNANVFCHRPATPDAARERAWTAHLEPLFAEFGASPPPSLELPYDTFLRADSVLEVLLEERPRVVSFHFGLPPSEWIDALREAGLITLSCVTNSSECEQAVDAGVDAVIAQGIEAGGHRGCFDPDVDDALGTFALVELLARRSPLPVIAAGGIMNGRGIAAAMQLGAVAVQLGTAFILCPESNANAQYRANLASDRAYHTRISAAISGRPARGLSNRLFSDMQRQASPALPDYPIAYAAAKALHTAASARGNHDFAVQWAGQGAPLARELPAAALVRTLMMEYENETQTVARR